jgi:hypothetical protein
MPKFIPGRYQYVWNMGTGDVRIYDVFPDGRVREKKSSTGEMQFISKADALAKLDDIISIYDRGSELYKGSGLYSKTYKTKAEVHRQIREFINERLRD